MRYLLTGGTGFIGAALCHRLAAGGARLVVLTREAREARAKLPAGTRLIGSVSELDAGERFDGVINLAGEPIADARWTPARKRRLEQSRITLTEELVAWIARAEHRPACLISASAVGFYGDQGAQALDEQSAPHVEYQHTLCHRWEEAARAAGALGVRTVLLRIGLVVGAGGGFLARMLPPFRLGLGGPIGNGRQWMSWIHREDLLGLIEWLLAREEAAGVYNATAPEPVDSRGFARALGKVLHRPALLPVPAPVLRLALGEMSCLLLGGQRVLPARALAEGYRFRYPSLEGALREATTPIV